MILRRDPPEAKPAVRTFGTRLKSFIPFFGREEKAETKPEALIVPVNSIFESCRSNGDIVTLDFRNARRFTLVVAKSASMSVNRSSKDPAPVDCPNGLAAEIAKFCQGGSVAYISYGMAPGGKTDIHLVSMDRGNFFISSDKKISFIVSDPAPVGSP